MADQTRREALAEAWDKMDKEENEGGDDTTVLEQDDSEDLQEGQGENSQEDNSGEPKAEEKESAKQKVAGDSQKQPKTEEKSKKPAPDNTQRQEVEAASKEDVGKAPNSWKPLARDSWARIPAEARAEISRRELEIQQSLSQTATVRKFASDFANVVNPFSHIIRAQNSTPLQAVQNLMQTAAGLMQGTQHQKAAIIAEILTNYGVDVQILDDYLFRNWNPGTRPGQQGNIQTAPQQQVPPWAQKIYTFMDSIEQREHRQKEEMKNMADAEIAKLETEPYFDDVREDIADILQIAADRGRKMTLKEAYDRACLLNPDVQQAIKAKKLQNFKGKQAQNQQHITRARRAASTLSGAPQGKVSGKDGGAKTRRQMLSEAWDSASE